MDHSNVTVTPGGGTAALQPIIDKNEESARQQQHQTSPVATPSQINKGGGVSEQEGNCAK